MKLSYPETQRIVRKDKTVPSHQAFIEDPYRWLEMSSKPEVQEWIKEQNRYTEILLDRFPNRNLVEKRLQDLVRYDEVSELKAVRTKETPRFFYLYRQAKEKQASLCYQDGENGKQHILINPLEFSLDGLVSIDWFYPSPNGKYLAYGLSEDGSEKSTLYVVDVDTGVHLSDEIPGTTACWLTWFSDNHGFYYTRLPLAGAVAPGDEFYNENIFYHSLGSAYEDDIKIFGENRDPTEGFCAYLSNNGKYMAIWVDRYTSSDLYVAKVQRSDPTKLEFVPVIESREAQTYAKFFGKKLFLLTYVNSPNGSILEYDLESFLAGGVTNKGRLLIQESQEVIKDFAVTTDFIAVIKDKNASSGLFIHDLESGNLISRLDFGTLVTLREITSVEGSSQVYFTRSSFFAPTSLYSYSLPENPREFLKPKVKVEEDHFIVKQVWYDSKDETEISMFLMHRKDITPTIHSPVFLTGYGGFGISQTPSFTSKNFHHLIWMENGGIVAIPNLRGGGEYGENWHKMGRQENRQNVFDDFLSAAEWLIDNNYGSKETLAISGRSNGGLTCAAAFIQRPDLFSVAYCGTPLLDMIRYTDFLMAKYWIPEYGDPEQLEDFRWLYKYSPYHNVKPEEEYPAVLFYTATSDSRVDPMHALKMAAKMQFVARSDIDKNPILLWVETHAGHGVGMPTDKLVKLRADEILHLAHYTGLKIEA